MPRTARKLLASNPVTVSIKAVGIFAHNPDRAHDVGGAIAATPCAVDIYSNARQANALVGWVTGSIVGGPGMGVPGVRQGSILPVYCVRVGLAVAMKGLGTGMTACGIGAT